MKSDNLLAGTRGPKFLFGPVHCVLFCVLILASAFLSLQAIHSNSVMLDEYAHVPAGISYWQLGRFSLYRENPPLVQCLVALPAVVSNVKMDYTNMGPARSEWAVGRDFLYNNAISAHDVFRRARCIVLMLSIVCGFTIFRWCSEIAGGWAALACASLWLLDPNVLAFSSVCTGDIGSATFSLMTMCIFCGFLKQPTHTRAVMAGFCLGCALATKFNTLGLIPVWFAIPIFLMTHRRLVNASVPWKSLVGKLAIAGSIAVFTLNSFYLFEGSFTRLGSYEFRSSALSGARDVSPQITATDNRFRGTAFSEMPVPLPKNYVLGLDSQKWESEVGLANLLRGELVRGGRWFTPFTTLLYKLPLGSIILLITAMAWTLKGKPVNSDVMVSIITGCFLMIVLCLETGLNWPVRYSLTAIPFFIIATGPFLQAALGSPKWRWLIASCILSNCIEVALISPHYLSFTNALGGGPIGGQRVFHGSNFDWGQDLYRLKRWAIENPDLSPLAVSYYGPVAPEFVDLPLRALPTSLVANYDGEPSTAIARAPKGTRYFYWALSSNFLNGMTEQFRLDDGSIYQGRIHTNLLKTENAVARIGYSIYIFRIGVTDEYHQLPRTIPLFRLKGCIHRVDQEDGLDASP